jgi:hypothetical protein
MNATRKPLPRFWYFPGSFKAAVVMTGDDHGSFYSGSATAQRFNTALSVSPAGCSVPDWQCVRGTSYLFPQELANNPLTDSQVASYTAQGFEVGVHVDSSPTCSNWTTAQLDDQYTSLTTSLAAQFPSLPAPRTHRMHCIGWSDFDSQPLVELVHGIRLDTSYYYWPESWINDQPGMFTGSGMPMRFTDRNGNLLDVYQATTQMTDESGQSYPDTINALLDNALGTTGYYGAFVVNAHNDQDNYPGIGTDILSSAQSRGVPIISSLQLLTWLDGRNSSSFGALNWSGNTLSFSITQAPGARNLRAMLPTNGATGILSGISLGGNPITFSTQTIKGISYAVFSAASGSYQAVYGGAPPTIVLTSVSLNPSSVTGGNPSNGTVTLSGAAPSGGALVMLSNSNTSAATVPVSVTVPAGSTSTTFSVATSPVAASATALITANYGVSANATLTINPPVLTAVTLNPTTVTGGSNSTGRVSLSGAAPSGGATVSLSSNNITIAQVPGSVTVPAGGTSATFTVTSVSVTTTTAVTVTGNYGGTASATLTVTPAASVSSVSLSPTSLVGGNNSTGTVRLVTAAPTGGASVSLSSSNTPAAIVPANVTVPAGATSATFTVTTLGVGSTSTAVITATLGVSRTATLTVNPATLSSLTRSPTSVVGGNNSTGTATLNGAAPPAGALVTLSSNNVAAAKVPASILIPAGSRSVTFTITTSGVASTTTVTLSGTYGLTRTNTLTVNVASLTSLTLNPNTVVGGGSSTGTLTLNGAAPPAGAVIVLTSTNRTAAQVPLSATIAANARSVTFTVTTGAVHGTSSSIRGTYRLTIRSATLTVQ